jgi:hypothetical protein
MKSFPNQTQFIFWLNNKPDNEEFQFSDRFDCLFARFLKFHYPDSRVVMGEDLFSIDGAKGKARNGPG